MGRDTSRGDHGRAAITGEAAAAAAGNTAGAAAGPAAAFFDVDNTLMRGASIYHFARGLAARDLFTTRDLLRFAWGQMVFRFSGNEQAEHINAAREAALAFVAGHDVGDLVALCEEIYDDTMADRIWEGARRLVQGHLAGGHRVWLVTATPVELADIIKRRMGLTGALGTVAETVDGVYTGRLVGDLLHGDAKAEAVRALAAHDGLDLAACTAYSDSSNDLPLLSMVGYPNAVNPDGELREHAESNGWPIHEFRTHRRTLRVGVPAAVAGAVAGGVAVGVLRRRRRP
ncbi:HAD superfamily hydrolase (TIGR01490 family) [Lipingzhangella halophila]|uniref:HAD superfamily hydrolase (TIGR01490 family) n=1 Tax=Lipingzhangella halophila TaxID=1783352 RepID=A0A7W7RLU6_9ACTN|nr:HAD-IB family hydrolase [Lipingzhangella halophila]MBB4934162.1 HAD superfamily hydrolase (TIGR01490 family) [Lipingzhangella halophila]